MAEEIKKAEDLSLLEERDYNLSISLKKIGEV